MPYAAKRCVDQVFLPCAFAPRLICMAQNSRVQQAVCDRLSLPSKCGGLLGPCLQCGAQLLHECMNILLHGLHYASCADTVTEKKMKFEAKHVLLCAVGSSHLQRLQQGILGFGWMLKLLGYAGQQWQVLIRSIWEGKRVFSPLRLAHCSNV